MTRYRFHTRLFSHWRNHVSLSSKEILSNLEERVQRFQFLELPGQPQAMHLGTLALVTDLWIELLRRSIDLETVRRELAEYHGGPR